ncbi:DUF4116 domain-containing protein [Legionella worsleiensis]|uniref:DUF4116 domain-containing protein n=1 Tax=Legionella worsleiensis TaxID=45076 RepID=A0A0W1AL03_9GAMM|nr:DUF4116 domain-containing protein [Legionella worsleiensis]KTD81974.1 hypothetical protein Lwor_0277 [Legionella worsleiensis]STY31357.1 Uncharacterised protein [Legionella worsleiensis]
MITSESTREEVLQELENNPHALANANSDLKRDAEFWLAAVRVNGTVLQFADEVIRSNKDVVIAAVKQNPTARDYATISLKNHEDVVIAFMEHNGRALEHELESSRTNKNIVLAAVKQDAYAVHFAAPQLLDDEEIIRAAVANNGLMLFKASARLQHNEEILLAATLQNADAIKYAPARLLNNREFVLKAVARNGHALKHLTQFANDQAVILVALNTNPEAIQLANKDLVNDTDFLLSAVKVNPLILPLIRNTPLSKAYLTYRERASEFAEPAKGAAFKLLEKIAEYCILTDKTGYWVSLNVLEKLLKPETDEAQHTNSVIFLYGLLSNPVEEIRTLGNLMKPLILPQIDLTTLSKYGFLLEFAGDDLKKDKSAVIAAVSHYGLALQFADDELKKNPDVLRAALSQNSLALQYAAEECKKNPEIVLAALSQNGEAIKFADKALLRHPEFALAAMQKNNKVMSYISDELNDFYQTYRELIKNPSTLWRNSKKEFFEQLNQLVASNVLDIKTIAKSLHLLDNALATQQYNQLFASIRGSLTNASPEIKSLNHALIRLIVPQIDLEAIKTHPWLLEFASEQFKANKDNILAAVQQNGLTLQYVPDEFKTDREIVLAAVQQDGLAIRFAPDHLKKDKEIALAAVQQKGDALLHTDKNLQPFLVSYLLFSAKTEGFTEPAKGHAQKLLQQVEAFYKLGKPNINQLKRVLDKTYEFLNSPANKQITNNYASFVQDSLKSTSREMRILGILMNALAAVVLGVSVVLAATAVSALPAIGTGLLAAGLFAAGSATLAKNKKNKKEEEKLIEKFTNESPKSP